MDRRTTIKWMFAAAATVPSLRFAISPALAGDAAARDVAANQAGYGTDPDLTKEWKAGGPWPLTLTDNARATTKALADLIIPADDVSPAASAVGVVDFIDEWISAPYPQQRGDRPIVLAGLLWIEAESQKRFKKAFPALSEAQKSAIADDICTTKSKAEFADAAKFFAKFRDLTAGGFYTTPVGMKDIGYTGNEPLTKFDGPPLAALKKAGLA
ncbi:MAG TPA: gluconate 2-dehydrogenase subunit 3 family protein [Steroidobacteraceae bacterium]|nr:gluconate 2-dehydrogenase subunit 3 family protein [Steroidobacteraceae bacterium]